MRPSTRDIIQAALRGDETVPVKVVEAILGLLDGRVPSDLQGPLLLKMKDAARLLGVGKTWFWEQVTADRTRLPKFIQPVEINPGDYRYRRQDIEAFASRLSTYAPKRRKQKVKRKNGAGN